MAGLTLHVKKIGDHRPPLEQTDVDHDIAVVVAKIGLPAFEVAYNAGRAMTMEQAIAYALEQTDQEFLD